jgi:protein-S-isoprenylcysteine O-methyltransferase Ste14
MPMMAYVQSAVFLALAAAAPFGGAGTIDIPSFWIYLAIFAAVIVVSFVGLDQGLLRERMRPGGQKPPVALRLFSLVLFAHWLVAGLDRGRFHWSDTAPPWLEALGLICLAIGYGVCYWAMYVNRFFSSVIRIQTDLGQYIVDTGPYAFIRHPGYFAGVVILLSSGIALGSWLAWALMIIASLPFLLRRAINEDRILQTDLPGYRDYAAHVRWRILPGVW